MKLSKKTRYGIRALMDLAASTKTEQVALNSIAQRNAISVQFLEQVFSALKRARLVRSVKGPQGGYLLEKNAADITVAEIVEALEGSYFFENETEEHIEASGSSRVIQELILDRVNESLREILENVTLKDLTEHFLEYRDYSQNMYYI
ncbi:RrF2 family transcriptional regulator [Mediterraneibacter sp. ICN-202921]|uniref:RrF2 family transcriptional regulator n=1 Tax=Mediterraneibacter sp. ICN-202921 TaxID=3134657 RepID=UPI0030BDA8F2